VGNRKKRSPEKQINDLVLIAIFAILGLALVKWGGPFLADYISVKAGFKQ